MSERFLVVEKSIEHPQDDILENNSGFPIQVSLPVVGEFDTRAKAENAAVDNEFVVEA